MNKKKIALFIAFVILVGMIGNLHKKVENVNGSDAENVIENQLENESDQQDVEQSDEIASQEDLVNVVPEKEVTTIPEEEERKKIGTAEFICCDEGRNVYLQKPVKSLGQTGFAEIVEDYSAIFSPAGKKAELGPVEGWVFSSLNITLEDGTKQECVLMNAFFSSIMDFRWIDEERIILEGHRNPSMNIYIVYNLKENNFKKYYGRCFTWDSNYDKLYYVETSPHFGPEPVPEKIIDQDENVYYETNKGEYLVNALVFDDTNEYIGFFVDTNEGKTDFGILNRQTMAVLYKETDVHYKDVEILVQ